MRYSCIVYLPYTPHILVGGGVGHAARQAFALDMQFHLCSKSHELCCTPYRISDAFFTKRTLAK